MPPKGLRRLFAAFTGHGAGGGQIGRGANLRLERTLHSKCRKVRAMHAPDGICRKPAGAREPVTGGTGGHGAHAPSGPRREWRRRGRRRTPPLGAALARLRALEPPPWAGRDAAGTPRAASGGAGRMGHHEPDQFGAAKRATTRSGDRRGAPAGAPERTLGHARGGDDAGSAGDGARKGDGCGASGRGAGAAPDAGRTARGRD